METESSIQWTVSVITSLHQISQMKEEWNRLLDESKHDTVNLTHEWLTTLWKHYVSFDKTAELRVFCIRKPDHELIAILPLMIVKIRFKLFFRINQLCFLGHDFNDYSGFIIKRKYEDIILNYFVNSILSQSSLIDWDVVLLKNLSSKTHNADYFRNLFSEKSYALELKRTTRYFYIKTDDGFFGDYYKTLSKNFKNDLRKCQNRLERYANEKGKKIRVIVGDDRIRDKHFILMLAAWQIDRMTSVQKKSSFANEAVRNFRTDFITSSCDHVLTVTLNMNDAPIAFCICLVFHKSLFLWIHGSDPEFYFLSPNKIILGKIIEYCFSNGFRYCDFNRGDHVYKEKWANEYYNGYMLRTYNTKKLIIKMLSYVRFWSKVKQIMLFRTRFTNHAKSLMDL